MVPAAKAARRVGVHIKEFEEKLPDLLSSGFPKPHPILGTYCLQSVDEWISKQTGLITAAQQSTPSARIDERIGRMEWQK